MMELIPYLKYGLIGLGLAVMLALAVSIICDAVRDAISKEMYSIYEQLEHRFGFDHSEIRDLIREELRR